MHEALLYAKINIMVHIDSHLFRTLEDIQYKVFWDFLEDKRFIVKTNNVSPQIYVRINSTKKCAFFPRMSKEFQSKASQGFSNTSHALLTREYVICIKFGQSRIINQMTSY